MSRISDDRDHMSDSCSSYSSDSRSIQSFSDGELVVDRNRDNESDACSLEDDGSSNGEIQFSGYASDDSEEEDSGNEDRIDLDDSAYDEDSDLRKENSTKKNIRDEMMVRRSNMTRIENDLHFSVNGIGLFHHNPKTDKLLFISTDETLDCMRDILRAVKM
jgi:hypothetical protein